MIIIIMINNACVYLTFTVTGITLIFFLKSSSCFDYNITVDITRGRIHTGIVPCIIPGSIVNNIHIYAGKGSGAEGGQWEWGIISISLSVLHKFNIYIMYV